MTDRKTFSFNIIEGSSLDIYVKRKRNQWKNLECEVKLMP